MVKPPKIFFRISCEAKPIATPAEAAKVMIAFGAVGASTSSLVEKETMKLMAEKVTMSSLVEEARTNSKVEKAGTNYLAVTAMMS